MRILTTYLLRAIVFLLPAVLLCGCIDSIEQHEIDTGAIDGPRPKSIPVAADDGAFLDFDLESYQRTAARAYRRGRYQQAAAYFLEILKRDVNNKNAIFDLAACYGQLGDAGLAANYLERAVSAGFDELDGLAANEAFDNVRGNPEFDAVLERIVSDYEQEQLSEGRMLYVESPRLLQCRVVTPDGLDPEVAYPLVIGLHGYGDNPNDFIRIWSAETGKAPDFICAAPQGPYPFAVDGTVGYSWLVWDADIPGLFELSYGLGEEYILNVVQELKHQYNVGPVYLMGFSQGSAMALTYGIRNPEVFGGVIIVGGMLGEDWLDEATLAAGNSVRVFVARGMQDRSVLESDVVRTRETLARHGYDVSFYEYPGGHELTDKTLDRITTWVTLTSEMGSTMELPAESGSTE